MRPLLDKFTDGARGTRPMALLALVSILAASPGCILTGGAWYQAAQTEMLSPQIVGSVTRPDGDPSAPEALVVEYRSEGYAAGERRISVLIPLEADGTPAAPFDYRGPARRAEDVTGGMEPSARDRLLSVRFPAGAYDGAARAMRSSRFVCANEPGGVVTRGAPTFFGRDVQVLPYRIGPNARPWENADRRADFPEDARVMLLPAVHPRPPGDRAANVAKVALLTPVLLLTDIVVTPIGYLMWAFYSG